MIAAATEPGIGPFSEPITVMTLEDGECLTLQLLQAHDVVKCLIHIKIIVL